MIRLRTVIFFFLILLAMSCRKNADMPLGKAPFLQQGSSRVDSLLSEMTVEEKIGQLIYVQADASKDSLLQPILEGVSDKQIGGLELRGLTLNHFLEWRENLQSAITQPMFWGSQEKLLLNGQFTDVETLPAINHILALPDDSLKAEITKLHFDQLSAFNFNLGAAPGPEEPQNTFHFQSSFQERHILSMASWPQIGAILQADVPELESLQAYRDQVDWGLGSIKIKWHPLIQDSMTVRTDFLSWKVQQQTGFDGLIAGVLEPGADPVRFLQAGADQIIANANWKPAFASIRDAVKNKDISQKELNRKVKRVLLAKEWTTQKQPQPKPLVDEPTVVRASIIGAGLNNRYNPGSNAPVSVSNMLKEHFQDPDWVVIKHALYRQSMILLSNPEERLPFDLFRSKKFKITQYSQYSFFNFQKQFDKYADYQSLMVKSVPSEPLKAFDAAKKKTNIVLIDQPISKEKDAKFIKSIAQAAQSAPLILINFGPAKNLAPFDSTLAIIQVYERNDLTERMVVQLLFGSLGAQGKLPEMVNSSFKVGHGLETVSTRLSYSIPQEVGIAPEKLVGIDAIMRTAIDEKVIPGGQILVAKEGKVIYSKAFGFHTFDKKQKVDEHHLYDVASITKVAATTLAAMQLYDLGKFKLNDRLSTHLDLVPESTIKNIPIKKLLIHQSGLQSNMPIAPYVYAKEGLEIDCKQYFCYEPDDTFSVNIASNMYFNRLYQDSLWYRMQTLNVRPQSRFRYSDVNFMLVQRLIEAKTNKPLNQWVDKHFYGPLGLRFSTFNPLEKFDAARIVPTQDDQRWRKQLLRGYVHDESAALMGGVGGSAGLFTTAEDLAVIFQLLLNRGVYGGRRYLEASTIDLFTSAGHGNHRGLGFDKPGGRVKTPAYAKSASNKTFGHTGFTGTCVWADPEHDLIFIFLSNRVYPNGRNRAFFRSNIRQRIHQVVYDALDTFDPQLPQLAMTRELAAK